MDLETIRHELSFNRGYFPAEAVAAAISAREEITPWLVQVLVDVRTHGEPRIEGETGAYFAHMYAFFLLAQFRERRACRPIVEFFRLPGERIDELTGEIATEHLGQILASVVHGDLRPLKALASDTDAYIWSRAAALEAMVAAVVAGECAREKIVAFYGELFGEELRRPPNGEFSDLIAVLVNCSSLLHAVELGEQIELSFQKRLVDPMWMDLSDIREDLRGSDALALERAARHFPLIEDTAEEMSWWACYDQDREEEELAAQTPYRRPQSKVGRNDPCPCGSGKKFKRCCGTE